ncbi:MAG: hypothetical protein ABW185_24125 [Sedimenticola sp.]
MDSHRLVSAHNLEIFQASAPFSSFSFIESNFDSSRAVHRCFSLARSAGFQTLVVEDIPEAGAIRDENLDIPNYVLGHTMTGLRRLSFWKTGFVSTDELNSQSTDDLIGYAIVKRDQYPSSQDPALRVESWHIFEAVFCKYPHKHNCVPNMRAYEVSVGAGAFQVTGVLYCQQNQLNKVCAHVALRSLLSRSLDEGDIFYSEINRLAKAAYTEPYNPANGLNPQQIRYILETLNIPYRDIYYSDLEDQYPDIRKRIPYQKYLYAGVESGAGALLGFKLAGPKANDSRHIIPFYGHTFNKDTWSPDAEVSYFDVGGGIGYMPSESWTSSFIGHDDNFGPNFCVPRLYVSPEQAEYVVELLHAGFEFSGIQAEAVTLSYLYSLHPHLQADDEGNIWAKRLAEEIAPSNQQVVLRAVTTSAERYLAHLSGINDWDGNKENSKIPEILGPVLPDWLWVVEVSLPQLFPANERKLGEVVLNPYVIPNLDDPTDFSLFLFARVPGRYFIQSDITSGKPDFLEIPSSIASHTELLTL